MSKLRSLFRLKSRYFLRNRTNNFSQMNAEGSTLLGCKPPVEALKDLGYAFNSKGELRKIVDGVPGEQPFEFNVSELHQECQVHYENVGMVITDYVYHLLEAQENMMRLPVPSDSKLSSGTFIFATKEYETKDILLLLLHGSGAVRAGQWARSIIINENLDKGTQIPYIKRAVAKDYGVLVLNTNDNYLTTGNKIPKSGTPDEHAQYVWDKYVANAKASSIFIVAHSYGGVVTMNLAIKNKNEFKKRVKAIALTDSVHGFSSKSIPDYVTQTATNWISSNKPLDTPMPTRKGEIPMVSAGHPKHEMTSYSCMDSVFNFFDEKLAKN
ncbi:cotranscriptional regulator ARB2A [Cydia amplana]|uniref:cotranscriptional regulator ARB2A n=1 Tax=Cydia amplana TaxID=1869771 RepID=UPI002FE51326